MKGTFTDDNHMTLELSREDILMLAQQLVMMVVVDERINQQVENAGVFVPPNPVYMHGRVDDKPNFLMSFTMAAPLPKRVE